MTSVTLENVCVDFPIYGIYKSFRHALLNKTVGGIVGTRADDRRVTIHALENLNLDIRDGDRVGLIGHNGAGKTTLLRVLAGVYEPTAGRVIHNGKVSALFNVLPGVDPDDTGYENIVTAGMFMGMSKAEIARKMADIESFTELGDYLSLPARTYSAGMLVRLGFAVATSIDPEVLLLDEGLGAGDARFADRAQKRVENLVGRAHILVIASHSDHLIKAMCNKAAVMHSGKIHYYGDVDSAITIYQRDFCR